MDAIAVRHFKHLFHCILYRRQREKIRNVNSALLNYKDLVDNYLQISDWRVKENSTVTYSVGGLILSNSRSPAP